MTSPSFISLDDLDFSRIVRPGDGVIWSQVTGEPTPLTTRLMEQRKFIGSFSIFLGASFSETVTPEHADCVRIAAIGGVGANKRLSAAKKLEILPIHISAVPQYIEEGLIPSDVAIVQIAPSEEKGFYEYAVTSDYIVTAVERARVVIGELNAAAPRTRGAIRIPSERLNFIVETNRPVLSVAARPLNDTETTIARNVAHYIGDEAVLQMGIGAIPDGILDLLADRRNLGVHSGMIGDGIVDLMQRGVITNACKPRDRGLTVTGNLVGTEKLYRFADNNPEILMHTVRHTHGADVLASMSNLISINSAIEVDLSGQVNSEEIGGVNIGAAGGQVDYVRGAHRAKGGRSIIALSSVAGKMKKSRIVSRLSGPVTTARSDVDIIVTEFGAAELRGRSLPQRAEAMIAIAHPDVRDELSAYARKILD
ncbi:MAG: acetyl-CoA hydrolase/transferase C-terminal domain-containing protein [Alphaproteobacteria bacterium]|nr:acetyl-CoA hydrolase/transferase C-terminal domain-containing protein [Alphaproteobacteria bacterium]